MNEPSQESLHEQRLSFIEHRRQRTAELISEVHQTIIAPLAGKGKKQAVDDIAEPSTRQKRIPAGVPKSFPPTPERNAPDRTRIKEESFSIDLSTPPPMATCTLPVQMATYDQPMYKREPDLGPGIPEGPSLFDIPSLLLPEENPPQDTERPEGGIGGGEAPGDPEGPGGGSRRENGN